MELFNIYFSFALNDWKRSLGGKQDFAIICEEIVLYVNYNTHITILQNAIFKKNINVRFT